MTVERLLDRLVKPTETLLVRLLAQSGSDLLHDKGIISGIGRIGQHRIGTLDGQPVAKAPDRLHMIDGSTLQIIHIGQH